MDRLSYEKKAEPQTRHKHMKENYIITKVPVTGKLF